jgi:hypothetical protein
MLNNVFECQEQGTLINEENISLFSQNAKELTIFLADFRYYF